MEKDAILHILLNDLKEIQTLVQTFEGKPAIPSAYFQLLRSKFQQAVQELELLEELQKPQPHRQAVEPAAIPNLHTPPVATPQQSVSATEQPLPATNAQPVVPEPSKKQEETPPPPPVENRAPQPRHTEPEPGATFELETELTQPHPVTPTDAAPPANKVVPPPEKPTPGRNKKAILGESFHPEQPMLYEIISSKTLTEEYPGAPVDDIRKALGINDRFYFQRELFQNNAHEFQQLLDTLNGLENFEQACTLLQNRLDWAHTQKDAEAFLHIVRRRFL